ncbi:MAG: hypothetical protein WKF78_02570 [Candidatus Limnocylindrales bacterium]
MRALTTTSPSLPPEVAGLRRAAYLGEEVLGPLVLRIRDHVLRGTDLGEFAVAHEIDPIGRLAGEGHLVGDHDHRPTFVGQALHHLEDLAHEPMGPTPTSVRRTAGPRAPS